MEERKVISLDEKRTLKKSFAETITVEGESNIKGLIEVISTSLDIMIKAAPNKMMGTTGEKDLVLSRELFHKRFARYERQKDFMKIIDVEIKALVKQGSIKRLDNYMYEVPDWDSLVAKLIAFNSVCGPY